MHTGQFITQARTTDGNLIQLRQISSAASKLPTIRPMPVSPRPQKQVCHTVLYFAEAKFTIQSLLQNVTKLLISGGASRSPLVVPSMPGTSQQIKLLSSPTSSPSVQRISLAQAQQMGLLGANKQIITPSNNQNLVLNKITPGKSTSSPKITMITQGQKTPTKILPAPTLKPIISAQPNFGVKQLAAGTQKVIIRQAASFQS